MRPKQTRLYCGECPFFRYEDTDGVGQCYLWNGNMTSCECQCVHTWNHVPLNIEQTLKILHHYQKWRRGSKTGGQPSPALVGLAIDTAIRALRSKAREDKNKL